MASLPVPGSSGNWGARLNAWLRVAHNDDGTLRAAPASPAAGMALRATTGVDGYRLAAKTGTVIGWMAPDDGQLHRALVWGTVDAASAVAGAAVAVTFTTPAGSVRRVVLLAQGQAGSYMAAVKAGTTVSLIQSSPLAAGGPAVLYADIWGM